MKTNWDFSCVPLFLTPAWAMISSSSFSTKVSGAKTSVKSEVMSRMVEYQAALTELEAAEKDCTEGTEEQLARMESAQNAFEAAGG